MLLEGTMDLIIIIIIISALHVSGGFSAHHQELIKLYVQPWVLSCFPAVYRWCGWVVGLELCSNPTTPAVDSSGAPTAFCSMETGAPSLGLKRLAHEANSLLASCAEVRNEGRDISTPHVFHHDVCRYNFVQLVCSAVSGRHRKPPLCCLTVTREA